MFSHGFLVLNNFHLFVCSVNALLEIVFLNLPHSFASLPFSIFVTGTKNCEGQRIKKICSPTHSFSLFIIFGDTHSSRQRSSPAFLTVRHLPHCVSSFFALQPGKYENMIKVNKIRGTFEPVRDITCPWKFS